MYELEVLFLASPFPRKSWQKFQEPEAGVFYNNLHEFHCVQERKGIVLI